MISFIVYGTGIPESNLDQDSQGDKKHHSEDNSDSDLDDFAPQSDTNTDKPATVTMKRSSGQHNASDHSDLEETYHEMSARKGKTLYN